jgi:hypothetical protein
LETKAATKISALLVAAQAATFFVGIAVGVGVVTKVREKELQLNTAVLEQATVLSVVACLRPPNEAST